MFKVKLQGNWVPSFLPPSYLSPFLILLALILLALSVFISSVMAFTVPNNTKEIGKNSSTNGLSWPNGAKAAISLSYDDALPSQLNNAVTHLNAKGFKGTFYLTLSAPTVKARLADWQSVAKQGHELGNHSINHPCRASLPNREWVSAANDLDKKTAQEYKQELFQANARLNKIDGKTTRTLTLPCGDKIVGKEPILPLISDHFVGIKASMSKAITPIETLDVKNLSVWSPNNVDGDSLIEYAKQAASIGGMGNYTFHGIGGDHLAISNKAHQTLLKHLADNPKTYWVATFKEIALYLNARQKKSKDINQN